MPHRRRRAVLRGLSVVAAALVGGSMMMAAGGAAAPAAVAAESAPTANTTPVPVAARATFYIDCSRSSNGDGTKRSPWNTVSAVRRHGAFAPGDSILLRRSTNCSGRLTPSGSGNPGSPIILGAYGSGHLPTVNGGGTPNLTGTVQLTDLHDWTVQDLHVTNRTSRNTRSYRAGVLLVNTGKGRLAGLLVQRLQVDSVMSNPGAGHADSRDYGGIAALTFGHKGSGFDHLRILKNRIDHVGRTGIVVANLEKPVSYDRDVRISGNSVRWARGDSIIVRGIDGGRLDHNVSAFGADLWPCKQCRRISPDTADAGIWPAASSDVLIDHNEVYGEHVKGGDGEGFDIDSSATNITLEYNYAHDNQGGGVLLCGSKNATVRFNIFENNAKSAIAFIGNHPAKNTSIYNNTIYGSKKTRANVVRTFNGLHGSKIRFFNNLVYSYGPGHYIWPTKVSSSSNTYVGSHGRGEPHGAHTSLRDPGLVRPGTGSVGFHSLHGYAKRRSSHPPVGSRIPSSVKTDFFGKRIDPSRPPRGAAA